MARVVLTPGYESFAAWLRDRRQTARLSLRDLGTRADINFTYLSKIEARTVPPPADEVVRRLAAALDATDDEALALAEQERRLPIRTIRAVLRAYPEVATLIERLAQELERGAQSQTGTR